MGLKNISVCFFPFLGERMHSKNDLNKDDIKDNDIREYNWWFNTYPLEYAEFLLVTALTRGVWLHPLAANDLGFKHIDVCSDDIYQQTYGNRFIICANIV